MVSLSEFLSDFNYYFFISSGMIKGVIPSEMALLYEGN